MVIREAFLEAEKLLKASDIEDASFNAKCLIRDIFGLDPLSEEIFTEAEKLYALIEKRIKGYPLQYLIGEWDFYDITLFVGEGVLIPRSDTETLVEEALKILEKTESPVVLDLCSGTGAIPLVLSRKKEGSYFAVEKEKEAYSYLLKNNERYGGKIKIYEADVLDEGFINSLGNFDLITANPPYLTGEEMLGLQKEVSFEPSAALYGGEDGLMFYRELARLYLPKLKIGGALVFEIGYRQRDQVENIMKAAGYQGVYTVKDLSGNDRVVVGLRG